MIMETCEPESPELPRIVPAEDVLSGSYTDFEFDVENTGGPSDGSSGAHTGSNPPP